jgi:hypothetical protein
VSWRFAVIFQEMLKKYSYLFVENIEEEGLVVFPPEMKRNQNNHFHSLQIVLLHRLLQKIFG